MVKYIKGQAMPRQAVMSHLMHRSDVVIEHLVRIYVNPNHQSVSHWIGEVHSNLPRIPKVKGIGVPSLKFILKYTYDGYRDLIPGFVDESHDKYGYTRDISWEELYTWVRSYFVWFVGALDNEGRANRNAIRDWILGTLPKGTVYL